MNKGFLLALPLLLVAAQAATAADGYFTFVNNSSATLERRTTTGSWSPPLPEELSPGASAPSQVSFPNGGVVVNSVNWRDENSITRGCTFRIQTEPGPVLCQPVAVVQPAGGASCHYDWVSRNTQTCAFDVVFTVSGF